MYPSDTEILITMGGAALLAALAYRHLVSTLIQLNAHLQDTLQALRRAEQEREVLEGSMQQLEAELTKCRDQLNAIINNKQI